MSATISSFSTSSAGSSSRRAFRWRAARCTSAPCIRNSPASPASLAAGRRAETEELLVVHGVRDTDYYLASPMRPVFEEGKPVRRRLTGPDAQLDYPMLQELRDQGLTDYLALPLIQPGERYGATTMATDPRERLHRRRDPLPAQPGAASVAACGGAGDAPARHQRARRLSRPQGRPPRSRRPHHARLRRDHPRRPVVLRHAQFHRAVRPARPRPRHRHPQ